MQFARWARRGLLVAGASLSTGCGLVDPCVGGLPNTMTGDWRLILVNGQPIPTPGYPLPFPSTDRLTSGILRFKTLKTTGRCDDQNGELKTEGRVVAVYTLLTASGQAKPTKPYGGTFEYNQSTGVVTLKAFGHSVDGNRVVSEFTVRPSVEPFGSYELTFQRQ